MSKAEIRSTPADRNPAAICEPASPKPMNPIEGVELIRVIRYIRVIRGYTSLLIRGYTFRVFPSKSFCLSSALNGSASRYRLVSS